jgi:glycosyltransferase involved in cell wall biosynthesis
MQEPRVSVCIVTYNHERYIRQCIMSVIAQTQDVPLEVLVGDDLSSDGTEDIVRKLADRFPESIRYFRHTSRKGPAGNYQHLIKEARGQYIAHLDGDDYWLPGKLARQVMLLDSANECPAAYSNALCINDAGILIGLFNNPLAESFSLVGLLSRGNFLNHSSLLYRATYRDELLVWPPDFIDYRIHLYLAGFGDIAYINSPCVAYRVNSSGSMLANQNEHVRELYWAAVSAKLSFLNDQKTSVAATADFLSRVFVRAREINDYSLLSRWWQLVTRDVTCNRLLLALWVVATTMRRRSVSFLNKVCGKLAGVPLRVIHRR